MMMVSEPATVEEEKHSPPAAASASITKTVEPPPPPLLPAALPLVKDLKRDLDRLEREKKAAKKHVLLQRVRAAQERARQAQRVQLEKLRVEEEAMKELERVTRGEEEEEKEQQASSSSLIPPPPAYEFEDEMEQEQQQHQLPDYLLPLPPPPPLEDIEDYDDLPPPPPMEDDYNDYMRTPLAPPPTPTLFASAPPPLFQEPAFQELPSAPPLFQPLPPPPHMEAPLAPPLAMVEEDLPPPSYQEFEQEEVTAMETDPRESQRILDEQTLLFEQLAKEKEDNDRAIAAAATEELEQELYETTTVTDNDTPTTENHTTTTNNTTITIGNNTRVQLRGEEVTMNAIARGEAMVVQCLACRNWMQIANTARLMFCPVCSTVSRAEPQTHTTLKEAQKRMAEKRQEDKQRKRDQVRNMTWGQYVKSFFTQENEEQQDDLFVVDDDPTPLTTMANVYGTEEQETRETTTARRPLISAQTGSEELTREMPAARIAEKKPLMSCVTNLGKLLAGGGGDEGNNNNNKNRYDEFHIDGVDSTSLLSVTRAGRNVS